MTKKEYNGYYNYETWLTALWIDNDQGLQEEVNELASRAHSPYALANTLEDFIGELNPAPQAGLFSDFINSCLSEVNWEELAETYYEENHESLTKEEQLEEVKARS